MPNSNIIRLDAYRHLDGQRGCDAVPTAEDCQDCQDCLPLPSEMAGEAMLPAAAMMAMGMAFWSNAFLLPTYASLSILAALSPQQDATDP